MDSNIRLRVIVVGAGLVGLVTAWSLQVAGHHVTVVEKRCSLNKGGAEIQAAPNAVRCLEKIGLMRHLRSLATPKRHVNFRGWQNLDIIARRPLDPTMSYSSMTFNRDDLLQALLETATAAGVEVLFGRQFQNLDVSRPAITFEDGETLEPDLIIGADGVHSKMRTVMFPDRNTAPVTTDTVSFQFSVPYDTLANDPSTLALWEDDCISMQMGDGQYSVAWTNNVHQTLFMILSQRNYKDHAPVAEWTREGDMQEVRELYGKFSDAVQRVLAGVDQCDKWRIVDSVSGADWTSLSGKVILIGDAIHAMPPHAAQGFAQGIEDAAALSILLGGLTRKDDLGRTTKAWADLRKPRVLAIQNAARKNLDAFTIPDGPSQQARDNVLRNVRLQPDEIEAWKSNKVPQISTDMTDAQFTRWVHLYDVVDAASMHDVVWKRVLSDE